MAPIVALIVSKILDYLAGHSGEIVAAIRKEFDSAESNPLVKKAVTTFESVPSPENLTLIHDALEANGDDKEKLAAIIVNNASA